MEKVTIRDEVVYLNKSKLFGWGVVMPWRVDGKFNVKNFLIGGSWLKFWIMVGIVIIILGCFMEYIEVVRIAKECLSSKFILK